MDAFARWPSATLLARPQIGKMRLAFFCVQNFLKQFISAVKKTGTRSSAFLIGTQTPSTSLHHTVRSQLSRPDPPCAQIEMNSALGFPGQLRFAVGLILKKQAPPGSRPETSQMMASTTPRVGDESISMRIELESLREGQFVHRKRGKVFAIAREAGASVVAPDVDFAAPSGGDVRAGWQ